MPNTAKNNSFGISDKTVSQVIKSKKPAYVGEVVIVEKNNYEQDQKKLAELRLMDELALGEEDFEKGNIYSLAEVKKEVMEEYGFKLK